MEILSFVIVLASGAASGTWAFRIGKPEVAALFPVKIPEVAAPFPVKRPDVVASLYPQTSIVGGAEADEGEFPWTLSLQVFSTDQSGGNGWFHTCGAALLNNLWAVTAAHCVVNLPRDENQIRFFLRVVGGTNKLDDNSGQSVAVWRFHMHDWYLNVFPYVADMALLRLRSPGFNMSDPKIEAMHLPKRGQDFTGATCKLAGWGITQAGGAVSQTLLKGAYRVTSKAECVASWIHIWHSHLCIIDDSNLSRFCDGDSGSALVCPGEGDQMVFAGIVSWAETDCRLGNPTVLTKVSWNYMYNFIMCPGDSYLSRSVTARSIC